MRKVHGNETNAAVLQKYCHALDFSMWRQSGSVQAPYKPSLTKPKLQLPPGNDSAWWRKTSQPHVGHKRLQCAFIQASNLQKTLLFMAIELQKEAKAAIAACFQTGAGRH